MAWEGSDRRDRLPSNWSEIRAIVLRRAGGKCEWRLPSGKRCPRTATDVDHRYAKTDDHRPEACQALCRTHHERKTAREGWAGRRRRKATPRREERQPGRLDQNLAKLSDRAERGVLGGSGDER